MIEYYKDFLKRPAWRGSVTDCPHCGHRMEGWHWEKYEHLREIITGLRVQFWKPAAVFAVSECPKCFKLSWNHLDLTGLFSYEQLCGWPKEDIRKLRQIRNQRLANGRRQYRASICSKCKHGQEVTYDYLYPRVDCPAGSIHCRGEKECNKFKEIK